MLFSLLMSSLLLSVGAFAPIGQPVGSSSSRSSLSAQFMVPRYDPVAQKWETNSPETDGPEAGYGPGKTLLLQGPKPFLHRIFQPDQYEQAVLKYMASENCNRIEAQGNMDAYLENPNDWAYNKLVERNGGYKQNYTEIKQKDVALTLVWSTFVFFAIYRVSLYYMTGENVWGFLGDQYR